MENLSNPSPSLKKLSLPFSDANLRLVNIITNLHSNLFQTVTHFSYNHFEIEVWLEDDTGEQENTPDIWETMENEALERIFVQCLALCHMVREMELDFIDFSHFQLLPASYPNGQNSFLVKFPLRLRSPLTHVTAENIEEEKKTELRQLLSCFQKNKYLREVNEKNYMDFFNRLKRKHSFSRQKVYVYKYDEFASTLLNTFPIDELKNETNIKIKIKTADPVQGKIIKRHLYKNYAAEGIFFVDLANHSLNGDLPQTIAGIISDAGYKKIGGARDQAEQEATGDDPLSIIQCLDFFLKKSAYKSLVLMIDYLKTKEDQEFINYLVHSSGINHIVLIVFTAPGDNSVDMLEFDLELNENPGNLLEGYLQFDQTITKMPLTREEENANLRLYLEKRDAELTAPNETAEVLIARLKYYAGTGQVKELNSLLEKYLLREDKQDKHLNTKEEEARPGITKINFSEIKTILTENLELLAEKTKNSENIRETRRLVVEILLKEGDASLAATLIRNHMDKDPVFLKLKLAQVYRVEKDYPQMHSLLTAIKADICEPWLDEFNYLNYIYYEKILDVKTADRYWQKLKKPLFIHLANIQLSDRYIYSGNFEKAEQLLNQAAAYLAEKKYPEDEIYARSQYAKLMRQKQAFDEAEKLYKNLFLKSEMKYFRLISANISVDLGNLYCSQDDFSQADIWYGQALKIFQNLKNKNGIMLVESNLAEINKIKGNWPETENYLKSILAYDKERKSLDSMAIDYINIAHLEYLKHNETGACEYLQKALKLFEKRKNAAGIIECELLRLKLAYLFMGISEAKNEPSLVLSPVPGKYRAYLTPDQEILFSIFALLMSKKKQASRQTNLTLKILNKIEQLKSRPLKFEILSLWILVRGAGKTDLLEHLKSISKQLSIKSRNYYFYEYYYVYFNDRAGKEKSNTGSGADHDAHDSDDSKKDIFMDTYYFFLKNKRKLAPAVIKYKNQLDEKDCVYEMFHSAELVEDSSHWKMPIDFFNRLEKELKKIIPVDRIQLEIYENVHKSPLFHLGDESKFKEITAEIMAMTRHSQADLNFTIEDIKRCCKSSEKAFYYYQDTKVLWWKISDTLFGVLLLGFLKDGYFDYDLQERSPELLKKFAPLIHKYYENNFKVNRKLNWLIGESPVMKRLKEQILKVSKVDFSLLIRGESGSGKELVAHGVHLLSKRSGKHFVAVNAAAIPENLLEAELFGYKKGAFTGATESKIGLIQAANQGTLFLDEIADLPLNLQAKMLRVLQENEIRRLGEITASKVDFRLICATNKDLKKLIMQNEFREDLYFRIQDLTIDVPPLVERTGDIPLLVQHFLKKYKFPIKDKSKLQRIIQYLEGLTWTGSVRELESTVKRMITYYPDLETAAEINDSPPYSPLSSSAYNPGIGLAAAKDNLERTMVYNALRENDWSKNKAAQTLKISRQHLATLMKKYNIED